MRKISWFQLRIMKRAIVSRILCEVMGHGQLSDRPCDLCESERLKRVETKLDMLLKKLELVSPPVSTVKQGEK